ncbi:MAG TPA: hypothetical protein VH372_09970 [Actinospica sp.]|jgi:hypothetical protein|nr:hypothetical protein [Actinospica sp.]
MARKTAGAKYPHASSTARQHDHRWCPVVGAVAEQVKAGNEEWGTPHPLPPVASDLLAVQIRQGLFRGRDCAQLKKKHGTLSVAVGYQRADGTLSNKLVTSGGKYILVVRVWSRDIAKQEIARRVGDGEQLHYNVLRSPS